MANAKIISGLSVIEEILLINFSLSSVLKDDSININFKNNFDHSNNLVLRNTNTPPKVIQQFTCEPFKVDMNVLKTIN